METFVKIYRPLAAGCQLPAAVRLLPFSPYQPITLSTNHCSEASGNCPLATAAQRLLSALFFPIPSIDRALTFTGPAIIANQRI